MKAECKVQLRFRKSFFFQALVLAGLIGLAHSWLRNSQPRRELGPRSGVVVYTPVALKPEDFAPFRLAGAWSLTSSDPRFGGVSALAVDGQALLALTDSAVVIRFGKPGAARVPARLHELPRGPGSRKYKYDSDSESLLRDPRGRGWWVGYENWNQAWLFDPRFARDLGRIDFGRGRWPQNLGIEGLASAGADVLMFPERGNAMVRWTGSQALLRPIVRPLGRISDATRLPGGGLVVIHRHWTLRGFANAITLLGPTPGSGLQTLRTYPLGGTERDNIEALAAERLPGGETRLWLMSDDNLQRPLRTLLIALDVPEGVGG